MKTKFNSPIMGLDGTAVKDANGSEVTLGKVLSLKLSESNSGDALKLFTWAQKFYAGDEVELDPSDLNTLKDFIKNDQSLTNLAKAQMLESLEK